MVPFIVSALLCLFILQPSGGWVFRINAMKLSADRPMYCRGSLNRTVKGSRKGSADPADNTVEANISRIIRGFVSALAR